MTQKFMIFLMIIRTKTPIGARQPTVFRGRSPVNKCFGPVFLTLSGGGPHLSWSQVPVGCQMTTFGLSRFETKSSALPIWSERRHRR